MNNNIIEGFEVFSPDDTFKLGQALGEKAVKGEVYALNGDLGVGKTIFSKGFAMGLGIQREVTSPTFSLIKEYDGGRLPFYHFDVYRIVNAGELDELGFDDYFYGNGVCLIEWADNIKDFLPQNTINVSIQKDLEKGEDYRAIKIDKELEI